MPALRRLLSCALLLPLIALAGCAVFSSDYWHGPSALGTPPPEPARQEKRDTQGGFTVLVEAPNQPSASRVLADVGAFAQRRGFVRQAVQPGAERYVSGKIVLDVTFRASDSRVVVSLHSSRLSRKFVEDFYHGFHQEYARQYGDEDPIIESDFGDEQDNAPGGANPGRGGGAVRGNR